MTDLDQTEFLKGVGAIIRDALEPLKAENASLAKRIEELEGRPAQKGDDGKSVTVEDVAPLIAEQVKAAVEAIPPAKDGEDAEPVLIADIVKELLGTDELRTLVNLEAVAYLEENPPPKGDTGKSVTVEDIAIFMDAALAKWALDFERRANDTLAKAIEKIPTPKDGKDGADFSDAELDYDGERGLIIRSKTGEMVKRLPIPMDRGYYRDGMKAEKGDILTHDGNAWLALKDTSSKPCTENKDDWRIFARKGRDGRDGKDGKAPPGPVRLNDA